MIITMVRGSRKNACPTMSIQFRTRCENALFTMSMRMCSFDSNVQGEHNRKMTLNSTHCSSSQALDEVSKTLRTVAFVAEIRTTSRISQDSHLPSRALTASIARLNARSVLTLPRPPKAPQFRSGAFASPPTRAVRFPSAARERPPNPNRPSGVNRNLVDAWKRGVLRADRPKS
jgi:hypothetical protein